MEAAYRADLLRALTACASGRWGLFGQNEALGRYGNSSDAEALSGLAAEIDKCRASLGMVPFPVHERFLSMRGRGANRPGEPKLARQLLNALEAEVSGPRISGPEGNL